MYLCTGGVQLAWPQSADWPRSVERRRQREVGQPAHLDCAGWRVGLWKIGQQVLTLIGGQGQPWEGPWEVSWPVPPLIALYRGLIRDSAGWGKGCGQRAGWLCP